MLGGNRACDRLPDTGDFANARAHYDQGISLYAPAEHRSLLTRFGQDAGVSILSFRSLTLWLLGYPDAALADATRAIKDAREIGHAASLMFALLHGSLLHILRGNDATVSAVSDELALLADEKDAFFWKGLGLSVRGCLSATTGNAAEAIHMLTSGIAPFRLTGATLWMPLHTSYLMRAYADLGQLDDAWRCVSDAVGVIETTKETWWEAELYRSAGEISLQTTEPNAVKAERYFERALAVARQQHAKSWELRASMSLARLWRDQRKVQQARELLAPLYGWFTEGFETRDLIDAKALLEELAA